MDVFRKCFSTAKNDRNGQENFEMVKFALQIVNLICNGYFAVWFFFFPLDYPIDFLFYFNK